MPQATIHGPTWLGLCVLLVAWCGAGGGGAHSSQIIAMDLLSGSTANATATKIVVRFNLRIRITPAIVQFCLPCCAGTLKVASGKEMSLLKAQFFIAGEKWTAISIAQ
jgi:hypothetical protein